MHANKVLDRAAGLTFAAVIAVGLASGACLAASAHSPAAQEYVGKWRTLDTQGKPMKILLTSDGVARGVRPGELLVGKWKVRQHSAVIHWTTHWVTKIVHADGGYAKIAYMKGHKRDLGNPIHAPQAVKVQ
jgi:hypothetical protein